jgi:hypothetical protein
MSNQLACLWCSRSFEPRRGGSRQTYCRPACRAAYHKAARLWYERAIANGWLTVQDLRSSGAVAYTLPQRGEPPLPLSNNGCAKIALPDAPLKFVANVGRDTGEWLVKLRFIPADRRDDLLAFLAALDRVGLASAEHLAHRLNGQNPDRSLKLASSRKIDGDTRRSFGDLAVEEAN